MTRYAPRWFEEFEPGDEFLSDGLTLTEGAIADFALTWDPQPFHLDATYGETSIYGGVIASGFHTMVAAFRMMHQSGAFGHNRGGRGIDDLKWVAAVRAGDTIRARATIGDMRPSRSTGHVKVALEVLNQRDEVVLTATMNYVIAKRPAGG